VPPVGDDGEQPSVPPVGDTEEPAPVSVFTGEEVSQFFGNGVIFSELSGRFPSAVEAVCSVKEQDGNALGACVKYVARGGRNGSIKLLMAVNTQNDVFGVRVLEHFEHSMDAYIDANGRFDVAQDVQVGATKTYNAVRLAISEVEALSLGGAV
jgi:hypothetical protein